MGIKDLFRSRQPENENNLPAVESDNFPIYRPSEVDLSEYTKLPITNLALLGGAFASLPAAARQIVPTAGAGLFGSQDLFIRVNPKGAMGKMQANVFGENGNIVNAKNIIVGRARYQKVDAVLQMPFDPMTFAIAVALSQVSAKLDALQKTADEILQFLTLDKQTKQRGNLNMLSEIMEDYKRNCENNAFCQSRNTEVLAIQRESHQNILFYQEQIESKRKSKQLVHFAANVKDMTDGILAPFYEYQLACHIYGFASMLDLMLQKRFDHASTEVCLQRMQNLSSRYDALYLKCIAELSKYKGNALESIAVKGIAIAAKNAGETIAKIPVVRNGSVDEALINAGKKLEEARAASIGALQTRFEPIKDCKISEFADCISNVSALCSGDTPILVDGENLYVKR